MEVEVNEYSDELSILSITGHQATKRTRGNSGVATVQCPIIKFTTQLDHQPDAIISTLATLLHDHAAPPNIVTILAYESIARDPHTKSVYIQVTDPAWTKRVYACPKNYFDAPFPEVALGAPCKPLDESALDLTPMPPEVDPANCRIKSCPHYAFNTNTFQDSPEGVTHACNHGLMLHGAFYSSLPCKTLAIIGWYRCVSQCE